MRGGLEIENKKEALDIDAMEETWSLTAIKRDALDTANYDVKKIIFLNRFQYNILTFNTLN